MAVDPFTYRCFDLLTMAVLDPMPFTSKGFGQTVNGVGAFTGTLNLADPVMMLIDWERSTRPDASMIVVDLQGTPVEAYEVTSRRYDETSHTLTISAQSMDQYFKQRLQSLDYTTPDSSASYWAANPADPTVIAAQILADSQLGVITMPGVAGVGPVCGDGSGASLYGVQVLVNGNPPPNIAGSTGHGWTRNALNVIWIQGINTGVVVGTVISGPNITTSPVVSVTQLSRTPTYTGATGTWTGLTNVISVHMPGAPAPIVGQLVVGDGVPIGATVQTVTLTGVHTYRVQLTFSTTVSHPAGTPLTITGYYTIGITPNAAATSAYTGGTYNFATASTASPTPVIQWINAAYPSSQLQTVDSIISQLATLGYGAGFDYCYDVDYGTDNATPIITLNISYPRRGKFGSAVTLVIPKGQIAAFEYSEDSTVQAIGIAETATGTTVVYANQASLVTDSGYAPLETAISYSQSNSQTLLTALAQGDLAILANPVSSTNIVVPLAMLDATTGLLETDKISLLDFIVGDDCVFRIDAVPVGSDGSPEWGPNNSPRFPNGLDYEFRIMQWSVKIPESGIPTLAFVLDLPPVTTYVTTIHTLSTGASTLPVADTSNFDASGQFTVVVNSVRYTVTYTGKTSTSFTGCTLASGPSISCAAGVPVVPYPVNPPPLR